MSLTSAIPHCCCNATLDQAFALSIPCDPGLLPGSMWVKEHLIKLREALSYQAWSPHMAWLTCWRRRIETVINTQRRDERDLLRIAQSVPNSTTPYAPSPTSLLSRSGSQRVTTFISRLV